jgi:dCTP deaminase
MILSDREILMEIEAGHLVFEPTVSIEDLSTTSVDLHLDAQIGRFKQPPAALRQVVDLSHNEVDGVLKAIVGWETIRPLGFELQPNSFILGYTKEKVTLPAHLAGRLEGRSTIARFGVGIHNTAPTDHATFSGHLMLEISNRGPLPCLLVPGMAICQLVIERVMIPPIKTLQSKWMGQFPPPATAS